MGSAIQFLCLGAEAEYAEAQQSPTFPNVPGRRTGPLGPREPVTDDTSAVRAFRTWVREHLAKNG